MHKKTPKRRALESPDRLESELTNVLHSVQLDVIINHETPQLDNRLRKALDNLTATMYDILVQQLSYLETRNKEEKELRQSFEAKIKQQQTLICLLLQEKKIKDRQLAELKQQKS